MICVIDHKPVDMTSQEQEMYDNIVKSYTTISNKGEDLFIDLFETDANGIILYLKPPSRRHTSFEIWMFLMSLQSNQHIRVMNDRFDDMAKQVKAKLQEIDQKLAKISSK